MPLTPPALDVAPTLGDAGEIKRGTTQQRDRLGLAFTLVAGRDLAVGLLALGGMPEQHMRQLVEPCLLWQRVDGVDGDRSLSGEPEAVAVGVLERDLPDVERVERPIAVPRGDLRLG